MLQANLQCENNYILMVTDYITKWLKAFAIPDQEATTVADKLPMEMFC